jgi:hypothetical protein
MVIVLEYLVQKNVALTGGKERAIPPGLKTDFARRGKSPSRMSSPLCKNISVLF